MYGGGRAQGSGATGWGVLRNFDAFPKQREEAKEFFQSTVTGGLITIVAVGLMALLFLSELGIYMHVEQVTELQVDTSRGEQMSIHLDVTLPRMPCSWITLDAMDVSGELHLDVAHSVYKRRLTSSGEQLSDDEQHDVGPQKSPLPPALLPNSTVACGSCYGAELEPGQCCNTCAEVREAYRRRGWAVRETLKVSQCANDHYLEELKAQRGEGCRVWGHLQINKVAGNIHVAPGKSYQAGAMHVHDTSPFVGEVFDFSHEVHQLAFGEEYPGMHNPLDGVAVTAPHGEDGAPLPGQHQYFLKVVPTVYRTHAGADIRTNQFSVTEHFKRTPPRSQELSGLFFFYDLSPIRVTYDEHASSFLTFLTSAIAIVGGVFTVCGIVDATVYHGEKVIRKKMQMGKQF